MEQKNIYTIYEGYMDELRKKVKKIRKKCEKYGCDFIFEEIGEEIHEVVDFTKIDQETGEHPKYNLKYILVHAEGTAVINGWEFVASVEHTEKGNIFSKALTDVEIPTRYRCSDPYCEHCNSNRMRKGTFIVRNIETGEFKQVGHNCLMDYTHGMSASCASFFASLKDVFAEEEERMPSGYGWHETYADTREALRYSAETIRIFGYSKSENGADSTRARMRTYFECQHGGLLNKDYDEEIRRLLRNVGFNADSDEAKKMVADALAWLETQEESNDYMHNLKVACSLDWTSYDKFGLLVSLFPTFNRELEREAKRKEEAEQGKASEYVGNVGDKVNVDVESVKLITSWTNSFGFNEYYTNTTYVWKIIGKDGNIYTWKTQKWIDVDCPPRSIKGTVKEHKEFREVKQTELTRCKI